MNNIAFNQIVHKLSTAIDKEGKYLNMDSIIISTENEIHLHHFKGKDDLHPLRSVCKCILSICVGIAIEEQVLVNGIPLNLNTPIWETLKDEVNLTNSKNLSRLKQITLFHLLTHTIGYEDKLLKSSSIKGVDPYTLLDLVINHDIKHDPGTHFVYSNASPYILSAFMQIILGKKISEYANERLFKPLEISSYEWVNYGKYCAGSTGLKMKISDLIKIGQIITNEGEYKSNRFVTPSWIKQMNSIQILTPSMYDAKRVFPKYGYGFLMWICENGVSYCDGSDGQYLIIKPEEKMVIAITGKQDDMKPITECLRVLINNN